MPAVAADPRLSGAAPVRALTLKGATANPGPRRAGIIAGLVGPATPVAQIEATRVAILNLYRSDGLAFTTVTAAVDPRDTLRISVIEGRIAQVKLDGDIGPAGVQALRFLHHLTEVGQTPRGPDGKPVTAPVTSTGTIVADDGSVNLGASALDVAGALRAGTLQLDVASGGQNGGALQAGVRRGRSAGTLQFGSVNGTASIAAVEHLAAPSLTVNDSVLLLLRGTLRVPQLALRASPLTLQGGVIDADFATFEAAAPGMLSQTGTTTIAPVDPAYTLNGCTIAASCVPRVVAPTVRLVFPSTIHPDLALPNISDRDH